MKTLNFSKIFDKRHIMIYLAIVMFIVSYIRKNYQIDLYMIIFVPFLVGYTTHFFGKKKEYDFITVATTIVLIAVIVNYFSSIDNYMNLKLLKEQQETTKNIE
jgi:hypothetical protein